MRDDLMRRVLQTGEYVAATRATVRGAANRFGVSKSTVHKDLTERLQTIDGELYRKVRAVLEFNRSERHIRGGIATRMKYKKVDNTECL